MSVDIDQKAQLYKITHLPTGKQYVGITWGKNHSYKKRFKQHMRGKGGVYIRKLLDEGSTEDDFKTELMFEGTLKDLYDMEADLSILYPVGLNGNKGRAIVFTDEVKRKRAETWCNRTEDEREASRLRRQATYDDMSEQQRADIKQKLINTLSNRTDQQWADIKQKRSFSWHSRPEEEKQRINKERGAKSVQARLLMSVEVKEKINEKRSKTLKKTLSTFTKEEIAVRMQNSALNLTDDQKIERGKKISQSKKGKSTNQYKIMETTYKNMSDGEFNKWCEGRTQRVITRATNLRNKK